MDSKRNLPHPASANDRLSQFIGSGGEEKGKPYVFKNEFLELTLRLNKDDTLTFKIKNLQNRRQPLDLNFRVHMEKSRKAELFKISGLPPLACRRQGGQGFVRANVQFRERTTRRARESTTSSRY